MTPSEISYFHTGVVVGIVCTIAGGYIVACIVRVALCVWDAWKDTRKKG